MNHVLTDQFEQVVLYYVGVVTGGIIHNLLWRDRLTKVKQQTHGCDIQIIESFYRSYFVIL